jgi:CopG antitoxin of type II toxin-antitoxin system
MLKRTNIPKFSTEQEEQDFWKKNDSASLIDWINAKFTQFPNLKSS